MKQLYTLLILLIPFVGFGQCIKGDCKNGKGTYTYLKRGEYVVRWEFGKRNGQGTYTSQNGNKYLGGWKDNLRNGQGNFTWKNGDNNI